MEEFHCRPCGITFDSWKLLWEHKCKMRDAGFENHKSCYYCGQTFEVARSELLHVQRSHEPAQDLNCPGCGQGPFNRVGTLVAHIERGQCTRVSSKDLETLREKKLDFHREMEARSDEPLKGSFANYMSKLHVTPWVDVVEAPSAERPGTITESDFPTLPGGKVKQQDAPTDKLDSKNKPDATPKPGTEETPGTEEEPDTEDKSDAADGPEGANKLHSLRTTSLAAKWQGAWGTADIQAAIAKDRRKPKPSAAATTTQPPTAPAKLSAAQVMDSMDIDDPAHPFFSASTYFSTVINKYICPKLGCGKYYDKKVGIIRHLRSPAHGDKSFQCPRCSRIFKSAEAIAYHAESPGHCRLRETEHYGAFVDQLTGGIVQADAGGDDDDGVKYSVQKEAIKKVFW